MSTTARRRGLAAAVTALLAMALAAAVAGRGCQNEDDGPMAATSAFIEASARGDRAAMYELLGPRTRQALDEAARKATELVGGEGRYEAQEMLQPLRDSAKNSELASERLSKTHARVTLRGADGSQESVDVVHIDGRWRIELIASPDTGWTSYTPYASESD